jgi:tripartite-type tricarboxylate transporter receptor subunit TctC
MRILAQKLSSQLGKNFIVENRPGAGGVIAAKAAAMAAPDGYTLVLVGNSYAISTALFTSLPYDVVKDFTPISAIATFDFMVATKKGSKFKTMKDVIAYAKENPGKLTIATLSPGTTQYLAAELLKVTAGVNVTAVPFRNSPDAATALLRGDVDLDIDSYAPLKSLLESGQIDVLATTGKSRDPFLKNVPTVIESGLPNFDVTSWNGIAAPAGVPAPIVSKLSQAVNEALQSPDVQATGQRLGMVMHGSSSDELKLRLKTDIAKWSNLIEVAHIPKQN